MIFVLTSGAHVIARGRLAEVITIAVERGLAQCERYPARRTGDDVVKFTLHPGVRIAIVPSIAGAQ